MTAIQKMSKARAGLILDNPFWGSLSLRLKLKEDPTCKTGWTDGATLGFSPEFVDALTLEETKGFVAHEVGHCLLAHQARRGDREPQRFNAAADLALNPVLTEGKFVLPKGALADQAFKDMSAEEIYSKLPSPSQGGDGGGDPDPGGCGEVRDASGPDGNKASPSDMKQAEEEWKVAVAQAAQQARTMGSLSAGLERLVGEVLEPKVDWREALRRFVDQSAKNDYSWSKPNKRYVQQGIYMPSLFSEELAPIVVAVDTSGSIGGDEVDQFAAEISSMLEEHKTSCTVIYCDSKVTSVEEFSSDDLPLTLHPTGGGGTDFRGPFMEVEERELSPSCLVYLTDGCCNSFPDDPEYPVMWAKIGTYAFTPPFGDVLEVT